jgi:hypothetical protein
MPPAPGLGLTGRRSKQRPSGVPGALSLTPQDDGSLTMAPGIYQYRNNALIYMPVEIIMAILIEWAMLEWFAPAIARRICRRFKEITDASPRVWSNLFLPDYSRATAVDVSKWLERAKASPKEIHLETEDTCIASAALKGAKDATSLHYRIPFVKDILQQERIRLPVHMPRLRHLLLNTFGPFDFREVANIFGPYSSARFPCLTTLHLINVDLTDFHIDHELFPAMRRLVLHCVCGPILNLIWVCSGSLKDLRVTRNPSCDLPSVPCCRT